MESVAVYCGSARGNSQAFTDAAHALGCALVARGLRLVYGGGKVGLMGEIADAVLAAGGEAVGVIPRSLVDLELAHGGLSALEIVDTMAQRKTRMEELADAFVCLPGGVGTLEEITEVLTMQQLGHIDAPVGFVDVAGYWGGFRDLLYQFSDHGFVQRRYVDALAVAEDPAGVLDAFQDWRPLGSKWA